MDSEIAACRALKEIAYRRVKKIKMKVLEQVYAAFDASTTPWPRAAVGSNPLSASVANRVSRCTGMRSSRRSRKRFPARLGSSGRALSPSDSSEAAEFAEKHTERIGFFEFLQWQADEQLGRAQVRAGERGMPVGIYRDLAVGASREGFDAWADQQVVVQKAKVGCPPDPFNMLGQDWGIPRCIRWCFAPWLRSIHCYATRQHAPCRWPAHRSRDGVNAPVLDSGRKQSRHRCIREYPFEELMGILALERTRNRCLIVGEDLGTVPAGFRERMADANVLSIACSISRRTAIGSNGRKNIPASRWPA